MSANGYNQRYPPQGPPPQQRYQQNQYPIPQRRQQNPPPNGYVNGQQQSRQFQETPYDRVNQNNQNNGYYNQDLQGENGRYNHYTQDTQWQNGQQGEQEQYMQPHNYQHDQGFNQPAREERIYQYDQRYRSNGQPRPPPQHAQSYGEQSVHKAQATGNPRPLEMRIKPTERQRILKDEDSPTSIPWDNPFGAFPSKKKVGEAKPPGSSDGKSIKSPEVEPAMSERPSTSHSNRKQIDPQRPHTSHGQRPHLQASHSESHHDLPPRNEPPRSQYPNIFDQPHTERSRSRPAPQRSMTGPTPQHAHDDPPLPPNQSYIINQYAQSGQQRSNNYSQVQRPAPQNGPMPPPQLSIPPPRSDLQGQMSPYDNHRARDNHQPTLYQGQDNVDNSSYRGIPIHKKSAPDIPNFDAISAGSNERTEDQLSMSVGSGPDPIYRKPTYRGAPTADHSVSASSKYANTEDGLTSPLAQFAFGVNEGYTNAPTPRIAPQSSQGQEFSQLQPQGQPQHYHANQERQEFDRTAPSTQYPPRAASRTATGRPLPSGGGYGFPPPVPAQEELQRRPTYDQDEFQNEPGRYTNGQAGSYRSHQTVSDQKERATTQSQSSSLERDRSGYDPRLAPCADSVPPQQYQQGLQQSQMGNGNYEASFNGQNRRVSADTFRSSTSGRGNPDSLPMHPAPYRPGLTQPPTVAPAPSQIQQPPRPPPTSSQTRQPALPATNTAPSGPLITVQELNKLRETFKANPNDHALGLKFAKRLVEAAIILSNENGKADAKQTAKNRERYILDAHKLVKRLISAGYPEAMFYMADCYGQGLLGLQPDPKEAFSLYQSAAKLGHAQGAYRVAVCCELGPEEGGGTRRDPLKSVQWYKRAASLGDTPAMYKMGMIQLKGLLGQPRNPREAISWLKRASERADTENPHALHELGLLYESAQSTDIVIRDERYALQLFTQAAELGYKYSQFKLGSAYEYGLLGCPIDPRLSIAWYSRAAAQGEHQSEFALSGWYLTGSGAAPPGEQPLLLQSDTEAYLWARKAATSGLTKAEYAMGYYTETGIGVAANVEEAKKWYFRAAAQNHPKARERLEELKRGGARMQKTRVSRSNVGKHNEGECTVM